MSTTLGIHPNKDENAPTAAWKELLGVVNEQLEIAKDYVDNYLGDEPKLGLFEHLLKHGPASLADALKIAKFAYDRGARARR